MTASDRPPRNTGPGKIHAKKASILQGKGSILSRSPAKKTFVGYHLACTSHLPKANYHQQKPRTAVKPLL
ncbi:hypothetical protein DV515_00006907 [Chloebia gouldiae]|uniref:Uncharacterized protein n=1 Tax=Chloebia gouldiae TaxID=44316 RepID=A0A3L8SIU6_CHLGU|nr:hypothetical protein DV515_00006907 [Chloebia gouldiae]